MTSPPARSIYLALALVAAATLLLEITLTRIFAFSIWYHFAFIVLAVALLGFGASGSALITWPRALEKDPNRTVAHSAAGAALGVALIAAVASLVQLNPYQLLSSPIEILKLVLYLAAATLPFFCGGLVVAVLLRVHSSRAGTLYFADLLGAGIACLAFVFIMDAIGPMHLLGLVTVMYAVAAFLTLPTARKPVLACLAALLVIEALAATTDIRPTESKLARTYERAGGERIHSKWSAVFRTDLYDLGDRLALDENPAISVYGSRMGGVSQQFRGKLPPFRFITHDGDASAVMVRATATPEDMPLFRQHLLGLPYRFRPASSVFIGGVGGGIDVLAALSNGVQKIRGVELDPNTVEIVCELHGEYVGHICDRDDVSITAGDARSVLRRSRKKYDVINFTGVDTITASATGAYLLSEGYLYTVEAFEDYFDHLAPGGVVSIITGDVGGAWGPPRMVPRFASVIAAALERRGIRNPSDHVAIVGTAEPAHSGMSFEVILTKLEPFTQLELSRIRNSAKFDGFVLWHMPDEVVATEAASILRWKPDERKRHLAGYYLDFSPVWDSRPFFMHFYKWKSVFTQPKLGPRYLEATGNVVLLVACGLTILAALLLVVWPAARHRRRSKNKMHWGDIGYFAALGVGFMFVEVALIQQLSLFLGYPTHSLTITLFSMLTFAGVGSYLSERLGWPEWKLIRRALASLALIIAAYVAVGDPLLRSMLELPLAARCAIAIVLIAPVGLVLGMFLPAGILSLGRRNPEAIPLAWAANGSLSVLGTVGAAILATVLGFKGVAVAALAIYALGALSLQKSVTWSADRGS